MIRLLVIIPLLGAAPAARAHGEPEPAQITVQGEIVDLHCYLTSDKARGPSHAPCARDCLERGQPMGLLTDEGELWVLTAYHLTSATFDAAKQMAGEQVSVEGVPLERGGVRALEVRRVGRRQPGGRPRTSD